MQKTYKCPNGHKFKTEAADSVRCSTCNEIAELVKWNTVEDFKSSSKGLGVLEEMNFVAKEIKGKKKP